MNIGETLLHDSKNGEFRFVWQSVEISGNVEFDFDLAAL